jgi:hypothetical protein
MERARSVATYVMRAAAPPIATAVPANVTVWYGLIRYTRDEKLRAAAPPRPGPTARPKAVSARP